MTLGTRGSHDNLYGGRNDLTLTPLSRNLVVGNGAPNSPRHSNYIQTYPLPPSRDARNYTRSSRPIQIQENDAATKSHHYSYDDTNYSEFPQTKHQQDSEPLAHRLPSVGNSQHTNGSRLPPINSAYQTNYNANQDTHRQRQLSINSIISSPGANTPSSTYSSFGTPAHGNGTMKKRKKSFGAEGDGGVESIDKSGRERDGGKANGDSGGVGMNGSHKVKPNVGLGLGLEDPDVRLAAEALGDLRADLNHSGIASRHQNHLQLSTTSSSSSSATTTGVNSPLSPSQTSNQYALHVNPEDAPLLDLIQNNPNPVLRATSAACRFSAAAYSTSKTLSPRFKIAAEQFESVAKGRLGGAVGGLVSTVGKRSGLESLVRRSLVNSAVPSPEGGKDDSRRLPPPLSLPNGTAKKRKTSSGEDTESNGGMSSASSTLGDIPEERKALQKQPQQDAQQQNWQTRLILSTPGIGAMSEESLKSLKYCLEWLRWANSHLGKCIETLKTVLEEYERNKQSMGSDPSTAQSNGSGVASSSSAAVTMRNPEEIEERKQMLMGRIERLKSEVLKTLKKVINVVDSYAGGALVGETRNMVKRQLLHLPQRLQIALVAHTPSADGNGNEQSVSGPGAAPGGDPTASAQRVIIVAKEGLDMMYNVSKLVELALAGAEEWCEKLGRKREPEEKSSGGDVKMVEAGQESATPKDQIMENGEKRGEEGDVEMEG